MSFEAGTQSTKCNIGKLSELISDAWERALEISRSEEWRQQVETMSRDGKQVAISGFRPLKDLPASVTYIKK